MVYTDGRIEIELAPADVRVSDEGARPRLEPATDLPPLTDEQVRDTIDATRR